MSFELLPGWVIPDADLEFRAVASGGPGGQNVNKVSTKIQLRFALDRSRALSPAQKARVRRAYPSHITQAGELLISNDETRSQETNKRRALNRLRSMLLAVRRPPKARIETRPTRAARQRRLADKQARGQLKQSRRRIKNDGGD